MIKMSKTNIKQKNEVEINDSNLKDFLENDVKGIEMILNNEDFISDLAPIPIIRKEEDFFNYYKNLKIIKQRG